MPRYFSVVYLSFPSYKYGTRNKDEYYVNEICYIPTTFAAVFSSFPSIVKSFKGATKLTTTPEFNRFSLAIRSLMVWNCKK